MNSPPTSFRSIAFWQPRWAGWLLIGLFMGSVQSASAQTSVDPAACWAAGDPAALAQARACQAHGGCALVLARRDSCAAAKAFLGRLDQALSGNPAIENNAVITAASPVIQPIPGLTSLIDRVSQRVQENWRLPPQRPGVSLQGRSGMQVFYEGQLHNGQPHGLGAQINGNGAMFRGEFVNGRATGLGQTVGPGGAVFVGAMHDGKSMGEGAMQRANGEVIVGGFDEFLPSGLITTYFLDGRSQKTYYEEKGKLTETGPMAAPGQVAADPDLSRAQARLTLSMDCFEKYIEIDWEPSEKVRKLRELMRGPCGADPDTAKWLAEAEKQAGVAASQERERALEQAAAKAQADSERSAMFSSFLGQVSSILGSYQVSQQMAVAEAAATAAVTRPPLQPSPPARVSGAPPSSPSGGGPGAVALRPAGKVAVPAVPGCAVYSLLPREFGRAYFQVHNPCSHGIEVYVKIEVDGQWTTYADMNREIGAAQTAKSNGGIPGSGTFQPYVMAVCPSKDHLERQLGARLTGVYTTNDKQFGCWVQYENTGVGRSN